MLYNIEHLKEVGVFSNLLLIFQLTEFGCNGQLGVIATLLVAKEDNQDSENVTHHKMAADTVQEATSK
jgi:hypothetical protein